MNNPERDIDAIATWERGEHQPFPNSGRRREQPGVCYECGADVPEGPTFGDVTCGDPQCRAAAAERGKR